MTGTPGKKGSAGIAEDVWRRICDYFRSNPSHQAIAAEFGINPGAMKMLFDLEPDDPRPMRALAEAFQCDASNITWLVDRLEERGLVERRTLPTDRRVKTVALTPVGEKTKAAMLERLYQPPEDLLALTRDQLVALRDALSVLPDSPPEKAQH
ncbi:MAG TPA: MarR family transcriptional regulator [Acidimicrobiales bacterium]|nr:MarR family transcriptional regulator [Acidimicrobiales bacterium]